MIPNYQTLMRPVLAYLAHGEIYSTRAVKNAMADEFNLSDQERAELLSSGQRVIDSRTSWAITYLVQAKLLASPERGQVVITPAGKQFLQDNPDQISNKDLAKFPSFQEFLRRSRPKRGSSRNVEASPVETEDESNASEQGYVVDAAEAATPEELAERAVDLNRAAVEADVLRAVSELKDPYAFEKLVIHLLAAMGYGKGGKVERTQSSRDGGIDGIISQDPLGLDRIYMQAKHYKDSNTVGRPDIQAFMGALNENQGDRGIFITSSSFTRDAINAAEKMMARIELIDGARLAELLVEYGVGTQRERTVVLHRLDEDFFETF